MTIEAEEAAAADAVAAAAEGPDPAAARRVLPFVVAITGKRDLHGQDEAVGTALQALFHRIDLECGAGIDKILLTGAACGADTIAAEAVRGRPDWSTIAILPLEEDLFRQDFAGEKDLGRLAALLAASRLRLPLKPLLASPGGDPLEADALDRRATGNPARSAHYEQLGLFLAEHAALLIAVDRPHATGGKPGGTGRVVSYRLTGRLDAVAADVVARSQELAEPPRLADACVGPVWRLDLSRLGDGTGDAWFEVLRPEEPNAREASTERVARSLKSAAWLRKVNEDAADLSEDDWRKIDAETPPRNDAAGALRRARHIMMLIQRREKAHLMRSVRRLALLFCAAVVCYEAYIELRFYPWSRYAIILYLAFAMAALAVYAWAKRRSIQADAENYRALGEALRIQLVWWDSGLTAPEHRVDRQFLQSAPTTLQPARDGLAQTLNAARLTGPFVAVADAATNFIEGQRKYFADRIRHRKRSIRKSEHASWFLFIVSLSVAASLVAAEFAGDYLPSSILHGHADPVTAALAIAAPLVVALLGYGSFRLGAFSEEAEEAGAWRRRKWVGPVFGMLAGLAAALGLYGLAYWLPPPPGHHSGAGAEESFVWHAAKDLLAMATILSAAVAGALRFVAEKLSWNAELSGYEEAAERFRRGDEEYQAADTGEERLDVLIQLGLGALRENEAWLRAHRERPLEPLVGG